jgi:hypothetical protein
LAEDAVKRSTFVERLAASSRAHTYALPSALALMFTIAALTRLWLTRDIVAPWIMMDELVYSELAKSFASSGDLLIREYPTALFTLYSIIIAPAWSTDSTETAYTVSKAINVGLMTLAAVPVFFWTRRITSPLYAVLATALVLAMPAFVYTGMLMTENAFFPAFVLATFAIAIALERPSLLRQAFVFAAIALACLVRVQGLVLIAMLPPAILIKVLLDLRAAGTALRPRPFLSEFRRYWISLSAVVLLAVGYLVLQRARGESLATGLGAYEITGETEYSPSAVARWFAFHLGEFGYSVGILPVSALLVCFGLAARWKADSSPAERALLAVAASSVLVVAQVAVYASQFAFRIEERNMFHIAPLLFIALAVWLYRGLPRPSGLTAIAVLVPAALLVTIPFEAFFTVSLYSDSFALIPLLRLATRIEGGTETVRVLLGLGLVGAGVLFAVIPRRLAAVLVPAAVIGFLLVSSVATFRGVRFHAVSVRGVAAPGNPDWIDEAIGTQPRAAFLFTSEIAPNAHILWQTEFWNRAVGNIYQVQTEAPGNPGSAATIDPRSGRILVADPRGRFPPEYAVGDANAQIVGDVVASAGPLELTRVTPPLRVMTRTEGVSPDGWMGPEAAYNHYSSADGKAPRQVEIGLSRAGWTGTDVPGDVRIRVGRINAGSTSGPQLSAGVVERTWVIHSGTGKNFVFRAPRPPFRVEVRIDPTFSPADYGHPDTRQLGAQVSFAVLPKAS